MRADLHVHSTASDGTLTPAQLVTRALGRGLTVLALTDHDSLEGLVQAHDAARGTTLRVIPGVEFSAAVGDRSVHLLGYFVDASNPPLQRLLARLREARARRGEAIVGALQQGDYDVTVAQVQRLSDGGALGRTHIARALVECGHAANIPDAFARLIGRGMPFYRPKEDVAPSEFLKAISSAGGISVLAHPGITQADDLIDSMVEDGLLGIEAYHVEHSAAQRGRYAALADERGLLVTGGSDFHSPCSPGRDLGSSRVPDAAVEALIAAGTALESERGELQ